MTIKTIIVCTVFSTLITEKNKTKKRLFVLHVFRRQMSKEIE